MTRKSCIVVTKPFALYILSAIVSMACPIRSLAKDQVASTLEETTTPSKPVNGETLNAIRQQAEHLQRTTADLYDKGKYRDAIVAAKQVVEINRQLFGDNHPRYAASVNNLGELYRAQAEYTKAEVAFSQALLILKKTAGKEDSQYALVLLNQALAYNDTAD